MRKEITLPAISENVESGEVIAILVSVGDVVEKDQPVVELETEKAAFEVPAPDRGRIAEINVKQGQTVKVGAVLARIETDAEAAPAAQPAEKSRPEAKVVAEVREEPATPPPPEEMEAAEREPERAAPPEQWPSGPETETPAPAVPVAAAPSVRQLARELGLDIARVAGSGPGGRVTQEDVKQHAKGLISGRPAPAQAPAGAPAREAPRPLPDFGQWGDIERQPLSKTRRTIADTISYGWRHIPHVTQYDKADITDLETFREAHEAQVEKAGGKGSPTHVSASGVPKLSVTSILIKIVAEALKTFPQFNASVDGERDEVVLKKYYHIAVAVDTERGLLVPVIRDVDKKGIRQVSVELVELAKRARDKQITPDEMMGGCFTVSNLGGLGGTYFAPIIYWPQVAILGVSRAAWEAVPRNGTIQPRLLLPLSLSYDHRVIDGADGTRFLRWIVQALEQPLTMML